MALTEVKIRFFQEPDRDGLIQLWKDCGLIYPVNEPNRDIDLKVKDSKELFLVALHGDILLGSVMIGYDGHRGHINYLGVSPGFQGRGLGRLLMERAEKELQTLGCPKINLFVRASNKAVMDFYEKLGYRAETVVNMGKRF